MKQTIALILGIAMLMTMTATSFAALSYPVAGVSSKGYVLDDDGDLYLGTAADKVSYGRTIYYPLLSASTGVISEKYQAYQAAYNNFNNTVKPYYNNTLLVAVSTAQNKYDSYDAAKGEYDTAYSNAPAAIRDTVLNETVAQVDNRVSTAQGEQYTAQTDYDVKKGIYDAAAWELDSGLTPAQKTEQEQQALQAMNLAEGVLNNKKDATADAQKAKTLKTKQVAYLQATGNTANVTAANTATSQAEQALTAAQNAASTYKTNTYDPAETLVETTHTAYTNAQNAGEYPYVYETDATKSVKISTKWEENGSYVKSVTVAKRKVSDSTISGATTSSMKYPYFLIIEIKSSTSTADRDLLGTVTLKKSGTDGFEVSTSIGVELGYSSASSSEGEGVIPRTPATFKNGDGFDAEDPYTFTFSDDRKSFFEVNTVGQGSIVLSFTTDYDENIGDLYPNANLSFYNGNYASFNRVGKLYLGYNDDSAYVYAISSSGALSRVEAEWDEYEDCYVITTRTLGRYVISDTRLSITNTSTSSSSGSSSGSGSSGGTVNIPVASSASSYTYTPPAASTSTPPPAASSQVSSQEPESSEEPEESEPEDEDEDEDEIVSVVVDEDDSDGPEKKSGISGWVWALIITGLTAVPVAIGVIYYLNNRPIRREFFNDKDEEHFEDDDDYED